jgi:hypothetical protein
MLGDDAEWLDLRDTRGRVKPHDATRGERSIGSHDDQVEVGVVKPRASNRVVCVLAEGAFGGRVQRAPVHVWQRRRSPGSPVNLNP